MESALETILSEYGLAMAFLLAGNLFLGYRVWQRDKFFQTEFLRLFERYEKFVLEQSRLQERQIAAVNLLREALRK